MSNLLGGYFVGDILVFIQKNNLLEMPR